jgi:AcrR family transcriptional regulator
LSIKITPKGQSSRQAVIKAAYDLFLEKGYHATSVRDISRQCGLTIGGVYTHFTDKEQIFMAVLDEYHPFWQVLPALTAAQGDSVDTLIHDMARRMMAALGTQREALNLIFIEIVEFQGKHFADLAPRYFPHMVKTIEQITSHGGTLRPIPPPILARTFFGLFFSYFMTNIALSNQLPEDEKTLDTFVDIYLYGILSSVESQ